MKNKKMLPLILFVLGLVLITVGVVLSFSNENNNKLSEGNNKNGNIIVVDGKEYSYKIDVPYYGNITVGSNTFNMLTTDDDLDSKPLEGCLFYLNCYEDEVTEDRFDYETSNWDDSYEVIFETYNDTYIENGCEDCDISLSNNIKLPKGIGYSSTIDDVIKAYGEPKEQEDYDDYNYMYNDNTDGEKFGKFPSTRLLYKYKKDNVRLELELFFDKDDDTLYRVVYTMEVFNK